MIVPVAEVESLVATIFRRHGCAPATVAALTATVLAAEIGGTHTHGLFRMQGYVDSLGSGWVDGQAVPVITRRTPSVITADGRNGFTQVALAAAQPDLIEAARASGLAALAIGNAHHFAAVWPDLEPLAEAGLAALAFVNARSFIVPWGGRKKLFGTNPMGFAWPRPGQPPLLWDQASSVTAHAEILIAARDGRTLPEGVGYDPDGNLTTDPGAILASGALAPFGGHKGSAIALMVELMAAGLSGGLFGFEEQGARVPGAATCSAGMTLIAIDPAAFGDGMAERAELLFEQFATDESARLPGNRRIERRLRAAAEGLEITDAQHAALRALAGE